MWGWEERSKVALRSQYKHLQDTTEVVSVIVRAIQSAPWVQLKCYCTVTSYFILNVLPPTVPNCIEGIVIVLKYKQEWE